MDIEPTTLTMQLLLSDLSDEGHESSSADFFGISQAKLFASNYASHLNALIMAQVSALDKVENAIES